MPHIPKPTRLCRRLRGVAALAVVLCHLRGPLGAVTEYGWLGVQVFFVLSGFVMSQTLARYTVTPRFVGNFILRRSVRLDPVYWS